ncbi:ATP-dependent DNA helicase RecG [Candidatus Uhrbacteria bacterium RIFOXYC2_FULL_47_19]|uniref:Probable DNA 3'-5' helicase RecG n=1 Tax=Candidatus Uhrbacteria bacterium RIFOXYC2_FULL_47_19 TaxID=1802424 RepID=A0A1F7WFB5_9BACT|nr:MAG: ATP-dependent DNA helicase RecG [Candidatus Uhrbacteria bacterium RIFOXYC2_FULL_47_19]HCC21919.1 ATP-dependent DNA helicase RecG [Candidatus Uhrbacteria bacterium]
MKLSDSVSSLRGTNSKQRAILEVMGLTTVRDLIFHFPFRYEDFSVRIPLSRVEAGMDVTVVAKVERLASRRAFRRRLSLTEAFLSDGQGTIAAVWFNQPYLSKYVRVGETYRFAGKAVQTKYGLRLHNPVYGRESLGEAATIGPVSPFLPIYPSSAGLTQFVLRKLIRGCLSSVVDLRDHLPEGILDDYSLMSLPDALRSVHFPEIIDEQLSARRRLAFDELLRIQLAMGRTRRYRENRRAKTVPFGREAVLSFVESLPFKLTDDQRRAAWEAIRDMEKETPMNRLLDGDVGSGKTAVAALAAMNAAAAGHQTAIMAPTEILALQHYRTLSAMYAASGLKVALWTNSYHRTFADNEDRERRGKAESAALLSEIASSEIDVVVGTQALVEPSVRFASLVLVVVDEQHRFGVRIRQLLCDKGSIDGLEPHLLTMTATPIPRSLALAVYGDLDLSVLKEKPIGRQSIKTKVVSPRGRKAAYDSVRHELESGRQAFVVCPLIESSDMLGVTSVTEEYDRLIEEVFPDFKVGQLHGRLPAAEKEEIMQRFRSGEIKVLVATSVIEVGVDVPNATVMCIEGADRFGLAQLHQFRGRVGRGEHQSYCFLFPVNYGVAVRERLSAMEATDDGFVLAEKDLALRGPGDLLGVEQSGHLSDLRLASVADMDLVRDTRAAAQSILEIDPELDDHPALREFIGESVREAHLE